MLFRSLFRSVRRERNKTVNIYCEWGVEVFNQHFLEELELVHNNFGWEGNTKGNSSASGWYHIGIFNSNVGSIPSNTYKSNGEPFNYRFRLGLISNIK